MVEFFFSFFVKKNLIPVQEHPLYFKVVSVMKSCQNLDHIATALKYTERAAKIIRKETPKNEDFIDVLICYLQKENLHPMIESYFETLNYSKHLN